MVTHIFGVDLFTIGLGILAIVGFVHSSYLLHKEKKNKGKR